MNNTKEKLELLEKNGIVELINDAINLFEIKEFTEYEIRNPKQLIEILKQEYLELIEDQKDLNQIKLEL